jgi:hypothetical protein
MIQPFKEILSSKYNRLNSVNFDKVIEDARKEASSKGYSNSPSLASQKLKSQRI